ncbi:MAG: hypothetical protein IAG13_03660 [Deltaproteobacteria bacterium]|nr:hypothetical protein [Nannocystaceae bacterium]
MHASRRRGGCAALALAVACGPAVDDASDASAMGESSTSDGPASSTGAVSLSTTDTEPTSSTTGSESGEASTSSTSDVDTPWLDMGTDPPPEFPDPGERPDSCTMPTTLDAELEVLTPNGAASMHAAVFAATGGGKCWIGYRVLLAPDLVALATEVDHADALEDFGTAVAIDLSLPVGSPEPGEWEAMISVWIDGEIAQIVGTATITEVTRLDVPEPWIEGSIAIEDSGWSVQGSFAAPYCDRARGPGCGA